MLGDAPTRPAVRASQMVTESRGVPAPAGCRRRRSRRRRNRKGPSSPVRASEVGLRPVTTPGFAAPTPAGLRRASRPARSYLRQAPRSTTVQTRAARRGGFRAARGPCTSRLPRRLSGRSRTSPRARRGGAPRVRSRRTSWACSSESLEGNGCGRGFIAGKGENKKRRTCGTARRISKTPRDVLASRYPAARVDTRGAARLTSLHATKPRRASSVGYCHLRCILACVWPVCLGKCSTGRQRPERRSMYKSGIPSRCRKCPQG